MNASGMSTTLASFIEAVTGIATDVAPIVVSVAVAFVAVAAVFIGVRYIMRAAKVVK